LIEEVRRDQPLEERERVARRTRARPPHSTPREYVRRYGINPDTGEPLGFRGYEYLRAILADPSPRVVIQKAAQVGVTVTALWRSLWWVEVARAHTLYLFPTHVSALRFARGRVSVLLEHSEHLREVFSQRKLGHWRAGHVNLYCHGGRSRTELMSIPVQALVVDERDEMYVSAAGAPRVWSALELARQRLSGQKHSWEWLISTPTLPGLGISADFAASDQHHYHLRCPYCRRHVLPSWPDMVRGWTPGADPARAQFACPGCGALWSEAERRQAIARGRWLARAPDAPTRGYHVTQLIAPHASAERLARQAQAAEDDPTARQAFYNLVLGLPYHSEGTRLERRYIEEALERGRTSCAPPQGVTVAGIDVGGRWLHAVVARVCARLLWVIQAQRLPDWHAVLELLRRHQVQRYVVDALPETHAARQLLQTYPNGSLCYYRPAGSAWHIQEHIIRAPRTETLDALFACFREGRVAATELPEECIAHLTSLVRLFRRRPDGQFVAEYVPAGGPDHFAHALGYCLLAAELGQATPVFRAIEPRVVGEIPW